MSEIAIEGYASAERAALNRLLEEAALPSSDIREADLPGFRVARDAQGVLIGAGGLECYGHDALLRSIVVDVAFQGRGIGARLVAALETEAQEQGIERIYLLTTSAAVFFGALGYRACERADVPAAIREGTQFSSVCPASAKVLCKNLAHA